MSAVWKGLLPAPGAIRLLLVRLLPFAVLSGVAFLVLKGAFVGECGYGPCGPRPGVLDLSGYGDAIGNGGSTAMGVVAGVAALFWLWDQVVTAAALHVLNPRREGPVVVWRALWDGVRTYLLRFLRIALLGAVLGGVWALVVWKLTGLWDDTRDLEGWLVTSRIAFGAGRAALVAFGLGLVGNWVFWLKVMTVADSRKRVRRTIFHSLRLLWRRPVRAYALSWLLAMAASATLPATTPQAIWLGGASAWIPWAVALPVLFLLWYWRIHVAVRVYGDPDLKDLHERSDEPFGVWAWVKARVQRLRGRVTTA